jgi:hypothetical protein
MDAIDSEAPVETRLSWVADALFAVVSVGINAQAEVARVAAQERTLNERKTA